MKKKISIVILGIAVIAFHFIAIAAVDAPHNECNNVSCGSCHGQDLLNSPFWGGSMTYDQLCLSCHRASSAPPGGYTEINAPLVKTHSSLATSAKYGNWARECRTCHDPHYQRQKAFKNSNASSLYLATGTITSCEYNGGTNTTTLTYSSITYKPGWDAAKLSKKTGEYRRTIIFPNVGKLGYSYPVVGVDEPPSTITVKGDARPVYQYISSSTFAVLYGQYIKDVMNVSGINTTVKFFDQTGMHSFADGDGIYSGVCEVCHTQTEHFRNDGGAPTQNHGNLSGGEADGTDCILCHSHADGFGHGGGSPCIACHGHDAGYEYSPGEFSQGEGTFSSHSTHTENDSDDFKGPFIDCEDCHDTNNYPYFKSGSDINGDGKYTLSETNVCDACHSSSGSYNGIDDPDTGAKRNWYYGIYEGTSFKTGKEKWCAGCHDENPANSRVDGSGINAPNVIGRETDATPYGTGYGFYKTGHGLPKYETYPASGAVGAGAICTDCHDASKAHFDHEHRTYQTALDNYQAGYRLVSVAGGNPNNSPMDIPKSCCCGPCNRVCSDPQLTWNYYALCFKCHDRKKILGGPQYSGTYHQKYYSTNLRMDFLNAQGTSTSITATTLTDSGYVGDWPSGQQLLMPDSSHPELIYRITSFDAVNHTATIDGDMLADNPALAPGSAYQMRTTTQGHIAHLADRGACGGAPDWDSDWNGSADSPISCPACHNVHGSPSARMAQHGELISTYGSMDKVPSIDFYYLTYLPNNTSLKDSVGGRTMFIGPGPGNVGKNKICNMCHNDSYLYYREAVANPVIVSATASDTSGAGCGLDAGDQVVISFSKETNGSSIITNVTQLGAVLPVSGKNWGTATTVVWSSAGGHTDDTLTATLSADASVDIGDTIVADGVSIQDVGGNAVANQKKIAGTFGCAAMNAVAWDRHGSPGGEGIQSGDQVVITFSTSTQGNTIDGFNIDSALELDNGHTWGTITSAIWTGSGSFVNNVLTITLDSGATIAVNDTVTSANNIIKYADGRPITASDILGGSFTPIILSAEANDSAGGNGKSYYDYVKIKFSTATNGYPIGESASDDSPPHDVDNALNLSSGHHWTSKNTPWPPWKYIYAKWLSETYSNDTLLIHVLPGFGGCDPGRTSTVAIGDTITLGSLIRDSQGNDLSGAQTIITGSWDGWRTVTASDASGLGPCVQAGDKVVVSFDKGTNGYPINAGNIDSVLPLNNGHSWKDGSGQIGSAVWSNAGGREKDTLTVTLSCNTSCPTVTIGDYITFGEFCGGGPGHFESRIKDENGASISSGRTISGNFGGAPPTVTSVVPNTAGNYEDVVITITGTGLTCTRTLQAGGVNLATWTIDSDNQITATIPACTFAAGTYHTSVWTNEGYSTQTASDQITVSSVLSVTSVSPDTVVNDVDTPVTVSGSGFSCATGVMLKNIADSSTTDLTTWTKDSDLQITAVVPAGTAPANYHLIVNTGIGNSPETAADRISVTAP
ncbi:MAG: cytochrome c3 family protein [Nitrospirota bacterium]